MRRATIAVDVRTVGQVSIAFFFRIIVYSVAIGALAAGARFGIAYDPNAVAGVARLAPLFLDSLGHALPWAVLLAFAASLIKLLYVNRFRRLAGVVLWAFFVLVFGVAHMHGPSIRDAAALRPGSVAPVVRSGGITRFPHADLLVTGRDGYSLLGVLYLERNGARDIAYLEEAFVDPFNRKIELVEVDRRLSMAEAQTGPTVLFRPPELLERVVEAAGDSHRQLNAIADRHGTLRFWIEVVAVALAVSGTWALAHMSRWPLLNASAVLFTFAAIVLIHPLLYGPETTSLFELVFSSDVAAFGPTLTLAAVWVGLTIFGLIFPSPERIQRELRG